MRGEIVARVERSKELLGKAWISLRVDKRGVPREIHRLEIMLLLSSAHTCPAGVKDHRFNTEGCELKVGPIC